VDLAQLAGWELVVAPEAGPGVRYAAEEFQHFCALATGSRLPIVTRAHQGRPALYLGPSSAMRNSPVGFSVTDFAPEEYRIVLRPAGIAVAGGSPRGTLYGVYALLEDHFGVRFLTAAHTHVPALTSPHWVGPLDRQYRPPLLLRWSYYQENARAPEFATRMRINAITDDPRLGGRSRQRLISHSFHRQIPSARYGLEHPDYYALRDGVRLPPAENDIAASQPCLTHPEVLRIVTEAVLADLRDDPGVSNVAVSQNDSRRHCQCPECARLDQREATPMGSLLTFVNAVAERVAADHPEVQVGTLAYQYSRRPPANLKPRPNVQIQLCSIECCQLHSIDDPSCPRNAPFQKDLEAWGRICDQIFIWNYTTNFENYLLPMPNLRVIGRNIRTFVAMGAKGLFMQGAGDAIGSEFADLRNYLISRLLWDPSLDDQALIDEFLDLHYGPSAGPIRAYLQRIQDRAQASGRHQACFAKLFEYGLDASDAEAGLAAFAQALALAPTPEVADRVRKASISAYRAALEPVWYPEAAPVDPVLAERLRPLAEPFLALCETFGIDRPQEDGALAPIRQHLQTVLGLTRE
jgi:hypothetical protein